MCYNYLFFFVNNNVVHHLFYKHMITFIIEFCTKGKFRKYDLLIHYILLGCKIRFNGVIEIMCRSYGSPTTLDMYCNKDCKKIGLPYGKCVTGNQCECYVK